MVRLHLWQSNNRQTGLFSTMTGNFCHLWLSIIYITINYITSPLTIKLGGTVPYFQTNPCWSSLPMENICYICTPIWSHSICVFDCICMCMYIYIYVCVCMYISVYHYNVFVYVIDMIRYDTYTHIYMYILYLYLQANGGMSTVSLQTLALQGPFAATLGSLAAWEISFSRYISTYFRVFKKDNFLTSVLWFFYTSVFSWEVPFWCLEFWIVLASSSSPCCRPLPGTSPRPPFCGFQMMNMKNRCHGMSWLQRVFCKWTVWYWSYLEPPSSQQKLVL